MSSVDMPVEKVFAVGEDRHHHSLLSNNIYTGLEADMPRMLCIRMGERTL